jgi:hypothetical protein
MTPEEMIRYLQDQLGRAMPDLLSHMLARTETRITVERDMARQDYLLHIDLIFEGRRLASYQNRIPRDVLEDGLRSRPAPPTYRGRPVADDEEMSRLMQQQVSPSRLDDIRNFFGVLPDDNPRTVRRPRAAAPGLRTPVEVPPLPVNPPPRSLPHVHVRQPTSSAPALGDRARRLDFGDDEDNG